MKTKRITLALAALLAAGGLGVTAGTLGCAADDDAGAPRGRVTTLPDPDEAIGEPLMLALAQAKNFHHKAKVYMADGDLVEATASVRQILAIEFPAGAPEGEDVRLDAHALLAKLLVGQGQREEAMKIVEAGIAQATRDSFFLANLHTVRGEVLEAQAAVLADDPSPAVKDEVKRLRRAAIEAFDRSIAINEGLQRALFEEIKGGSRPEGSRP